MNIKIVSDGNPYGTQIIDADTGEVVHGMRCTRIVIDANDRSITATCTVDAPLLNVVAHNATIVRDATLVYDPDDTESIDKAIDALQQQRAARVAS